MNDQPPILTLLSFGHKHGPAPPADLVFDARPLPNPYWQAELRPRHGLEPEIAAYVLQHPSGRHFLDLHLELLRFHLQNCRPRERGPLRVAVGCTGGRHRSPAVVQALADALALPGQISIGHRDLNKDG